MIAGSEIYETCFLVNSRVLISKIDVIQGFWRAISLFFVFEVSFLRIMYLADNHQDDCININKI